jgi:hypothetical protein
MEAPAFRVPEIPTQAYRSFRTMAEAELSMPRMAARSIAVRIDIPWALTMRRRIQRFIDRRIRFCDTKAIQEANCSGPEEKKEDPN